MRSILEALPDAGRVAILLKCDAATNAEIAEFAGMSQRSVRHELEKVAKSFPELDDGRGMSLLTLAYLIGLSDAGVPVEELPAWRDALVDRAGWLRSRMRQGERMVAD